MRAAARHVRMKYLDHCHCGAVIVTFQTADRTLVTGCDCLPECEHPHAAAVYDMSYAVMGTPELDDRPHPLPCLECGATNVSLTFAYDELTGWGRRCDRCHGQRSLLSSRPDWLEDGPR